MSQSNQWAWGIKKSDFSILKQTTSRSKLWLTNGTDTEMKADI